MDSMSSWTRNRIVGFGFAIASMAALTGCGSEAETVVDSTASETTIAVPSESESSVPVQSVPVESVPVESVPVESVPVQSSLPVGSARRTVTGTAPLTIAVGTFQGCKSTGVVECWGANDRGQLGQGHTNEVDGTVVVQDFSGATSIASGDQHVCGLVGSTGEVFCWGLNDDGELGLGELGDRPTVRRVNGLPPATLLAAGDFHTCAVAGAERDLWCWGMNTSGQLGSAPSDDGTATPRRVEGVSGVLAVDGGFQHTCVVVADGTVKCFGDDLQGQSGGATPGSIATVQGVADAVDVRVGMYQSCARIRTGEVRCWGSNQDGQFGSSVEAAGGPVAVPVPEFGSSVEAIAVGLKQVCALTDGRVSCLGASVAADGSGSEIDFAKPQPMPDPVPAVAIAAGYNEVCAIHADASVACWNYEPGSAVTLR
jgi:hypothetical protein